MGKPVRFNYGVNTAKVGEAFADFPFPDPMLTSSTAGRRVVVHFSEFTDLGSAASRTVTGSGSAAAGSDGDGGVITLTPGGATTASAVYRIPLWFRFQSGYKAWYMSKVKFSAVASTMTGYFGLRIGSAATDGLWFAKSSGSTALDLIATVDSTATTLVAAVDTVVADTYMLVGWYYDGKDLLVYKDNALVARILSPTIGATATTLPDDLMNLVLQITPTATQTISSDCVLLACEFDI